VVIKSFIFSNITRVRPVKSANVSEQACRLLDADFLFGLLLDPEDEGVMFLRNVVSIYRNTQLYISEDIVQ
jgi:hypothetical protein